MWQKEASMHIIVISKSIGIIMSSSSSSSFTASKLPNLHQFSAIRNIPYKT